ncbi:hypothetical protein TWF281_005366 [Arthrobotrys megalospora]
MTTVNVNLDSVVYTNLETPTPWAPTHTRTKRGVEPKDTAGTPTEMTATHTFSIVTNGFVVATFTAVGTSVSPPRGVSQPSSSLPPWEVVIIILSAALFCFILTRTFWHHRRFEMMMKKEEEAKGPATTNPTKTDETHDEKCPQAVEMQDIVVEIPITDGTRESTAAFKLNTKYIPKDAVFDPRNGEKRNTGTDKS